MSALNDSIEVVEKPLAHLRRRQVGIGETKKFRPRGHGGVTGWGKPPDRIVLCQQDSAQ
jgi:hypothetical protein